jgi:hypothetical protein
MFLPQRRLLGGIEQMAVPQRPLLQRNLLRVRPEPAGRAGRGRGVGDHCSLVTCRDGVGGRGG